MFLPPKEVETLAGGDLKDLGTGHQPPGSCAGLWGGRRCWQVSCECSIAASLLALPRAFQTAAENLLRATHVHTQLTWASQQPGMGPAPSFQMRELHLSDSRSHRAGKCRGRGSTQMLGPKPQKQTPWKAPLNFQTFHLRTTDSTSEPPDHRCFPPVVNWGHFTISGACIWVNDVPRRLPRLYVKLWEREHLAFQKCSHTFRGAEPVNNHRAQS